MTDTITERLKAITKHVNDLYKEQLLTVYGNRIHQDIIEHIDAIQSTISSAETDAGKIIDDWKTLTGDGLWEHSLIDLKAHITAALLKAGQDAQAWKGRAEKEHELRLAAEAKAALLQEPNIDKLINKFLMWPLPKSVCSDTCVSDRNYKFPRNGTSLLSAYEAKQMIEYLLDISPPSSSQGGE